MEIPVVYSWYIHGVAEDGYFVGNWLLCFSMSTQKYRRGDEASFGEYVYGVSV